MIKGVEVSSILYADVEYILSSALWYVLVRAHIIIARFRNCKSGSGGLLAAT